MTMPIRIASAVKLLSGRVATVRIDTRRHVVEMTSIRSANWGAAPFCGLGVRRELIVAVRPLAAGGK